MVPVLVSGGKAIRLKLLRQPEPAERRQAETEIPEALNQSAETRSNTGWKNSSVLCLNLEHLKKRKYVTLKLFFFYYLYVISYLWVGGIQ